MISRTSTALSWTVVENNHNASVLISTPSSSPSDSCTLIPATTLAATRIAGSLRCIYTPIEQTLLFSSSPTSANDNKLDYYSSQ